MRARLMIMENLTPTSMYTTGLYHDDIYKWPLNLQISISKIVHGQDYDWLLRTDTN